MDEQLKQRIKETLLSRWKSIGSLRIVERHPPEEVEGHTEIVDIAQSLEQLGRDTSLAEQERRELAAIERAIGKLSSAAFGVCEDCSEEIPYKRLLAIPEARFCANCQAFEERAIARNRMPGAMAR